MNRICGHFIKIIWVSLILSTLVSCSTLSKLNPMNYFRRDRTHEKPVTRAEYNELLKKYEKLLAKHTPAAPAENKSNKSDEEEIEQLEKLITQVLNTKKAKATKKQAYSSDQVRKELKRLAQLKRKMDQKKFGDALLLVKELEGSHVEQVRAQTRFYFAEILFMQEEYDLAMQIYEEIMIKMDFSIYAKESLEKLVLCTSKLNRDSKNTYYQSLLKKFGE